MEIPEDTFPGCAYLQLFGNRQMKLENYSRIIDYDEKKLSFQRKLHQMTEEKAYLEENIGQQKNISKRMDQLRKTLENEDILDEFDRIVFESIVEKVIVGETNDDGTVDPFKLTFVMKGNGNSVVPNAKEWFKAEKSTTKTA